MRVLWGRVLSTGRAHQEDLRHLGRGTHRPVYLYAGTRMCPLPDATSGEAMTTKGDVREFTQDEIDMMGGPDPHLLEVGLDERIEGLVAIKNILFRAAVIICTRP